MKKILLLLILSNSTLFSQERVSKNLGNFSQLKVFSGLNVTLIKIEDSTTQNYMEIKGSSSENVSVKNVNDLLKLSIRISKDFDYENTSVKLYYNSDFDLIDVNEGAFITSNKTIIQSFIELKAQEGAKIEFVVDVNKLKVKSTTGAEINLSGKTTIQTITANTGGIYNGFNLQSKQAEVLASTGAEVYVNVSELLNAKATLKGIIYYLKTPEKLIKKSILGGEILLK